MSNYVIHHQKGVDFYYKTWHTIGENMIIYMHSNGGSIVCSERVYPIKKGVLCFVGAKKHHYTMPDAPKNYDRSKVFISSDELHKLSSLFPVESKLGKIFTPDSLVYAQLEEKDAAIAEVLLDEIASSVVDEKYFSVILMSCYIRLLTLIDKSSAGSVAPSQNFISRAIEYINGNITENISIDDICAAVHTSKYYFCRQFKKATGLTVANYILKTRIVMAKSLLLSEDITVGEVSEKCGFSSISYFCRVFKNDVGVSPKQYRNQNDR